MKERCKIRLRALLESTSCLSIFNRLSAFSLIVGDPG